MLIQRNLSNLGALYCSDQMQAVMKRKRWLMLGQMYLSMVEYPKHDWRAAFGPKWLWKFHLESDETLTLFRSECLISFVT